MTNLCFSVKLILSELNIVTWLTSYNRENLAHKFLPGGRKLPDYEGSVPRVPVNVGPSGTDIYYTEGIKAQADRFYS
ncbi:hypothetical protein JCM15060_03690 [Halanaerobaculum tunisiense]